MAIGRVKTNFLTNESQCKKKVKRQKRLNSQGTMENLRTVVNPRVERERKTPWKGGRSANVIELFEGVKMDGWEVGQPWSMICRFGVAYRRFWDKSYHKYAGK